MSRVIEDPFVRRQIVALFYAGLDDKVIAERIGVKRYKVSSTRRAIGLKRSCAPKSRVSGGFDKTGIQTVKKKPSNANARVNQFAVLKAYLDQTGSKNMAKVAEQFHCTRAYVSSVLMKAREGGLLNDRNDLYTFDHEAMVRNAVEEWEIESDVKDN